MKKLFKKIATVVAAISMVAAMTTTAFAADAVRVAGDEGLTGKAWSTTDNAMTDNGDGTYTITFKDVKAGEYGFKVLKGDAWGDAYNLEGAANGMGDDAKVKVEKDGSSVTITFDGTKAAVTVKEGAPAAGGDTADKPAEPPKTGDSTAVVAMVAVAAVAGALVVASRRQTANN